MTADRAALHTQCLEPFCGLWLSICENDRFRTQGCHLRSSSSSFALRPLGSKEPTDDWRRRQKQATATMGKERERKKKTERSRALAFKTTTSGESSKGWELRASRTFKMDECVAIWPSQGLVYMFAKSSSETGVGSTLVWSKCMHHSVQIFSWLIRGLVCGGCREETTTKKKKKKKNEKFFLPRQRLDAKQKPLLLLLVFFCN